MAILKEQPRQPKNAQIQVRVEEEVKGDLDLYAEFIHSNQAWVVSEALRFLFKKDHDFQTWKTDHNGRGNDQPAQTEVQSKAI